MNNLPHFKIVYHHDYFYLITAIGWFVLGWVLSLVGYYLSMRNEEPHWMMLFGLLVWISGTAYLFKSIYKHISQKLILDNSGIVMKTGILFVTKSFIPYHKINNIILDKFLFLEDIRIETSNDSNDIFFKHIEQGENVKHKIEQIIILKLNSR